MDARFNPSASAPGPERLAGAMSAPVRGQLQRSSAFYLGGDEQDGEGMDTADDHSTNFLQVLIIRFFL